jgi:hypothetical protein
MEGTPHPLRGKISDFNLSREFLERQFQDEASEAATKNGRHVLNKELKGFINSVYLFDYHFLAFSTAIASSNCFTMTDCPCANSLLDD